MDKSKGVSPSLPCVLFLIQKCADILLNRSQQLFSSCTAKFADGQQCSVPVFDITHQTPLCEEHAKKMVSTKPKLIISLYWVNSCLISREFANLRAHCLLFSKEGKTFLVSVKYAVEIF